MLKKLKILSVSLLILCTWSISDGLTQYPLNDLQMRKTARLMIEYTFLLDQHKTMGEMLTWCDSIHVADSIAIEGFRETIRAKDDQLANRQKKHVAMEAKFLLSKEQVKKEVKKKRLYLGTTIGALALLVLSMIN